MARILPITRIPSDLWSAGILHMPKEAADQFLTRLRAENLYELAQSEVDRSAIHGGAGEAARAHFAANFSNSFGRTQCALIGPDACLDDVSNEFIRLLSMGKLAVLDIPCGSGAGTLALCLTLAHLRESVTLPTLPLLIKVVGGDISIEARELYVRNLQAIQPYLRAQSISVELITTEWDATLPVHTARLVDEWFRHGTGANEYLVLATNFSGAAFREDFFNRISPCIEAITARLYDRRHALILIEPPWERGGKYIERFWGLIKRRMGWLTAPDATPLTGTKFDYQMRDPVRDRIFDSGLRVMQFQPIPND